MSNFWHFGEHPYVELQNIKVRDNTNQDCKLILKNLVLIIYFDLIKVDVVKN